MTAQSQISDITARLQTSPVFEWNRYSQARVNINQGGTSSGKTYAILQVIFLLLIEKRRIATVVGQDIPNLKKGALRDFQERILVACPWMNNYIKTYNKTERTYTFKNGSKLEFTSFKDFQDAKNGKRNIAFFNEANGISFKIYEQVVMRTTEKVFIDYNPSEEFWCHEKVMTDHNAVTFYSNFTHNPFCDESVIEYLYQLKGRDAEAWKVYGLGMTGSITELVFENVTIVSEMPKNLRKTGYGLDFGYRADPSTLIYCGLKNERDVYFDEVFFTYKMKTVDIDQRMKDEEVKRQLDIWADLSEDRVIDDLYDMNWNIFGADKGPGSIKYGIDLLKGYNLHITERSVNMINERKKYKHKVDKNGKILNEPADAFNHTWDAARYWGIMNLKPIKRRSGGVRRSN